MHVNSMTKTFLKIGAILFTGPYELTNIKMRKHWKKMLWNNEVTLESILYYPITYLSSQVFQGLG